MKKQTILFLAANPRGADRLALAEEARAIQVELERSGFRNRFEFVTRWAVEPVDLLRELRRVRPTIVHFSGHGGQNVADQRQPGQAPYRDSIGEPEQSSEKQPHSLYFQRADGSAQMVSTKALEETFGAAGSSVKLVVLNACYSAPQAAALLTYVDCVVGMSGSIRDDAARSFAIGFYGGLGECESIAAAFRQGCATISLEGLPDACCPRLTVRDGIDANQLIPAAVNLSQFHSNNRRTPLIIIIVIILGFSFYNYHQHQMETPLIPDNVVNPFTGTPITHNAIANVASVEGAALVIDDLFAKRLRQGSTYDLTKSQVSHHIVLDIRIRNSGSSTINLTRAHLSYPLPPSKSAEPVRSSTDYESTSGSLPPLEEILPAESAVPSTGRRRAVGGYETTPGEFSPPATNQPISTYGPSADYDMKRRGSAPTKSDRSWPPDETVPVAHVLKPGEVDNFTIVLDEPPVGTYDFCLLLFYNGERMITRSQRLEVTSEDLKVAPLLILHSCPKVSTLSSSPSPRGP